MSYIIVIFVAIFLANEPVQVKSTFYLEFNSEVLYSRFGLRTWLFECNGRVMFPGFASWLWTSKDLKPPILCSHLEDDSVIDEIYSKNNFFQVLNARLPRDQPIEFLEMFKNRVPNRLFLAVSHDFMDYPDFELPVVDGAPEPLLIGDEEEKLMVYYMITNLNVFQDYPDRFLPMFQAYMRKLRTMTDDYWQRFPVIRSPFLPQSRGGPPSVNEEPRVQYLNFDEDNDVVEKLLFKMIDPCFIVGLANRKLPKYHLPDMASEHMKNGYCRTYCRFLGVLPRVFGFDSNIPSQCKHIFTGGCVGDTCWCSSSTDRSQWFRLKVGMAECNNHVVSAWSVWEILRFPKSEDSGLGLEWLKTLVLRQSPSSPKRPKASFGKRYLQRKTTELPPQLAGRGRTSS